MSSSGLFKYGWRSAGLVDLGKRRSSNQDEIICCPEFGFFAVSDGMGGLTDGGKTSHMIKKVVPAMLEQAALELKAKFSPSFAAELLEDQIRLVSDSIFDTANKSGHIGFGATFAGAWLVDQYAVFVNLGDSRGYILPRYKSRVRQITRDHNVAAIMVDQGELTREEARNHPASSQLTRFVGMPSPAGPDTFIEKVAPGDRLLLCSDGLHGMIEDKDLPRLLRFSRSPMRICKRLIDQANAGGGFDNISAVFIKITRQ